MSRNDITGADLKTKPANEQYRDGWDRIFGKTTEQIEADRVATMSPEEQAAYWATKQILASKV